MSRGHGAPSAARPHIGIVTIEDDFHAEVVALRLRQLGSRASIVAIDTLPSRGRVSWWIDARPDGVVATTEGLRVRPADFDVIWWRRNGLPHVPSAVTDPDARRVVSRDAHATAFGLLATTFNGAWVSHPDATLRAENKLVQLQAAKAAGLRVPRTLVSQDPADIRAFMDREGGQVVVKTVAGALGVPLSAGLLDRTMVNDDRSLALSPAIYQEYIPGRQHLRVCCFGREVHAVRIESDAIDWRYTKGLPVTECDIDACLARRLILVMEVLGLRMGIFDLKVDNDGSPVWLEINPQGQFLFLEGLCGIPLARIAAEFLASEAASPPPRASP